MIVSSIQRSRESYSCGGHDPFKADRRKALNAYELARRLQWTHGKRSKSNEPEKYRSGRNL